MTCSSKETSIPTTKSERWKVMVHEVREVREVGQVVKGLIGHSKTIGKPLDGLDPGSNVQFDFYLERIMLTLVQVDRKL
jgi:hypothetical protein